MCLKRRELTLSLVCHNRCRSQVVTISWTKKGRKYMIAASKNRLNVDGLFKNRRGKIIGH